MDSGASSVAAQLLRDHRETILSLCGASLYLNVYEASLHPLLALFSTRSRFIHTYFSPAHSHFIQTKSLRSVYILQQADRVRPSCKVCREGSQTRSKVVVKFHICRRFLLLIKSCVYRDILVRAIKAFIP